jgi:hypothetical protein
VVQQSDVCTRSAVVCTEDVYAEDRLFSHPRNTEKVNGGDGKPDAKADEQNFEPFL